MRLYFFIWRAEVMADKWYFGEHLKLELLHIVGGNLIFLKHFWIMISPYLIHLKMHISHAQQFHFQRNSIYNLYNETMYKHPHSLHFSLPQWTSRNSFSISQKFRDINVLIHKGCTEHGNSNEWIRSIGETAK